MPRTVFLTVLALLCALVVVFNLPITTAAAESPARELAQAESEKPTAVVQGNVVNVRSGPGVTYGIIGRVRSGQKLLITGKNNNASWWRVCCVDTREGWISGSLVKAGGDLSQISVVAAPPPPAPAPRAAAAPAPNTRAAGFFGYGIQVDPSADKGFLVGAIQGMQFNWMKFQLPWKDLEGQPGQVDWGGTDSLVDAMHNNGINVLASIVKAPNWARAGNSDLSVEGPPADPGTYANFVRGFAARYCGRVQAVEVWNEQNLHREWGNEPIDPARYVRLLAAAYGAIKSACPSMIVVSGALTPTGAKPPLGMDDIQYLQAMYRAGLRRYSDAVGAHPSGYNCPADADWRTVTDGSAVFRGPYDNRHHSWCFRGTMEGYRNVMVANGDSGKRIWPTEFGWAVSGNPFPGYEYALDNTAGEQAEWAVRAYQLGRSWGWVGPMFLWNLNFENGEQSAFRIWGTPTYQALSGMGK